MTRTSRFRGVRLTEWGMKGGEGPTPLRPGHPHPDWFEVPKALAARMATMPPEHTLLILRLLYLLWEETEQIHDAGGDPARADPVTTAAALAAGTGLGATRTARALRELARAGIVESTRRGWRLLRVPE